MSDQTDSGLDARTDGNTQPQPDSQTTGDSKSQEVNSLAGAALAEALMNDPEALEIARRNLQSQKDRGVAKANKTASQALDLIQNVAQVLGIDPSKVEQAQREMVLNEIVNERLGNSQSQTGGDVSGEAPRPASSVKLETVQKAFDGLDWNDDRVLQVYEQYKGNKESLYVALGDLKATGSAKPTASPTMAVTPSGGNLPPADKTASLRQSYQEELQTLQTANRGAVSPQQLAALKKKYRDQGLSNLW